jgi:hypothetical protein
VHDAVHEAAGEGVLIVSRQSAFAGGRVVPVTVVAFTTT